MAEKLTVVQSVSADDAGTVHILVRLAMREDGAILGSRTTNFNIEIGAAVAQHLKGDADTVKAMKDQLASTGALPDDAMIEEDERDLRLQMLNDSLVRGLMLENPPEWGGGKFVISYPPMSESDVARIKAVMADAWTPDKLDAARKTRDENHAAYLADRQRQVQEAKDQQEAEDAALTARARQLLAAAGMALQPAA